MVSYPDFLDWRERTRVFSGLAVFNQIGSSRTLTPEHHVRRAAAHRARRDAEAVRVSRRRRLGGRRAGPGRLDAGPAQPHTGLLGVGRLAAGASIEQARSDQARVDREPAAELAATNREIRAVLTSRDRRGDRPPGDPAPAGNRVRLALGATPVAVCAGS
jgi:hypothetical protein